MELFSLIKTGLKTGGRFVSKHKKGVLMASGVVLTTSSIVIAVIKAPEAKEAIEQLPEPKEDEKKYEIVIKEVKVTAPIMWPVPVLAVSGISCFMVAMHISAKEATRAVTDGLAWKQAYNELAHIHNEYVNYNRKIAGEEIHKKVQEEVINDTVIEAPTNVLVANTGKGNEEFYDSLSGQFFYSSAVFIANMAMSFSEAMKNNGLSNPDNFNGFGTAEEWLEQFLMVDAGLIFSDIGWYSEDCEGFRSKYNPFRIYLSDHYVTGPDGKPARVIEYDCLPQEP